MTTLDGVERELDAETVLVCDRERPDRDRRDHGRPGLRGLRGDDPASCSRSRTGTGPTSSAPRACSGLRSEASSRFEKQLHPELCMRAQADRLAAAGRALRRQAGAGDDRRRRRDPRAARDLGCAAARVEGLLGMEIAQADQVAYLERLGFGVEADGEDLEVDGAARSPLRRHPRGRPDRGGRPGPRLRRAPADDAARGRPGRSAASAASSGCGAAPRTCCATSASTRSSAGASPTPARPARLRIPADDPRADAVAARQPALRGAVGDADDAARLAARRRRPQPRPRRRRASPCSSPAASTCEPADGRRAGARWRGSSRASGRRRSPSRTGSAASRSGRWSPTSWRGGGEPADFFALKGVLEALAGQLGVELELRGRRRSRSCIPAARPRSRSAASRPAGSARSTRWSAASGTSRPRSPSKSTPAALIGAASAGEETFEDVTTFPAVYQDLAVVVPAEVTRGRGPRRGPGGRRRAAALRPGSSTSTKASRSARGARAWRCGSSSAPPTAPSPTRRSPACARRSRPSWSEIGGTLRE